jgi:hypothetical protein
MQRLHSRLRSLSRLGLFTLAASSLLADIPLVQGRATAEGGIPDLLIRPWQEARMEFAQGARSTLSYDLDNLANRTLQLRLEASSWKQSAPPPSTPHDGHLHVAIRGNKSVTLGPSAEFVATMDLKIEPDAPPESEYYVQLALTDELGRTLVHDTLIVIQRPAGAPQPGPSPTEVADGGEEDDSRPPAAIPLGGLPPLAAAALASFAMKRHMRHESGKATRCTTIGGP